MGGLLQVVGEPPSLEPSPPSRVRRHRSRAYPLRLGRRALQQFADERASCRLGRSRAPRHRHAAGATPLRTASALWMVETRSQRLGPGDTTERSATSRPAHQDPGTAAPLTPAHVGASATFGGAPLLIRGTIPATPDMPPPQFRQPQFEQHQQHQQYQQQMPSGFVDVAQMFTYFQQFLESQQTLQQRQTTAFTRGIDDVHQMATATIERLAAQPQGGAGPPRQQRIPGIQEFKKMNPRDFLGTEGILFADDWIEHIEEIFRLAEIPAGLQVEAAASQMRDLARTWYQTDPRVGTPGQTWRAFKGLFKGKFFPDQAVGALETQFENLVQGNQTVEEYAGEFCRLSKFVEGLSEAAKARRFRKGLVKEVKSLTKSERSATFEDILAGAMAAEDDLELKLKRGRDTQGAGSSGGQAKRPHYQQQQRQPQQYQQPRQQQQAPRQQTTSCPYCKKSGHGWGECRKRLGSCLLCGAADHQLRECSQFIGRVAQGAAPGAGAKAPVGQQQRGPLQPQQQRFMQFQQQAGRGQQGRAYAMTVEDAQAVGDVLAEDEEEALVSTYYGAGLDDTYVVDPQQDPPAAEDVVPVV
ncbi:uncharacterized protein M6B38_351935 [Iris pallida]|uniref:Retrotransposon gag domain-containing protein n=1 Tax=Iris pallida TaxID=29817 RepID=A0AAX6GR76_IRIPA|nr:uncharacterized protein M6B38_351935 [Iris pallida]